jgi:hypothetical protein
MHDMTSVEDFSLDDLLEVGPVKRPSCSHKRKAPSSPLSLQDTGRSTRTTVGGSNWATREGAHAVGPRRDNFGNAHPCDTAIGSLGYVVVHHIDGRHNSRTRLTDRPFAKLGRMRPSYQPHNQRSKRLDSPEAVVREEMRQALTAGRWRNGMLPPRLQQYVNMLDVLVQQQKEDIRCKNWLTPNRWQKKRLAIHLQWEKETKETREAET